MGGGHAGPGWLGELALDVVDDELVGWDGGITEVGSTLAGGCDVAGACW